MVKKKLMIFLMQMNNSMFSKSYSHLVEYEYFHFSKNSGLEQTLSFCRFICNPPTA